MENYVRDVNLQHPLQDVNKLRDENFDRPRFKFAKQLLPENGEGSKLVDIGGGACEFLRIARDQGYYGIFVDGNPLNVKRAEKLGFDAIFANFNEKINLPPNSTDGVIMLDVIEHVSNAEFLLSEVHRILKPGGFLIISTPNIASIGLRLSALKGEPPRHEGYHLRFFNKPLLDNKITEAKFKIIERNPIVTPKVAKLIAIFSKKKSIPEKLENLLARVFVIKVIK